MEYGITVQADGIFHLKLKSSNHSSIFTSIRLAGMKMCSSVRLVETTSTSIAMNVGFWPKLCKNVKKSENKKVLLSKWVLRNFLKVVKGNPTHEISNFMFLYTLGRR